MAGPGAAALMASNMRSQNARSTRSANNAFHTNGQHASLLLAMKDAFQNGSAKGINTTNLSLASLLENVENEIKRDTEEMQTARKNGGAWPAHQSNILVDKTDIDDARSKRVALEYMQRAEENSAKQLQQAAAKEKKAASSDSARARRASICSSLGAPELNLGESGEGAAAGTASFHGAFEALQVVITDRLRIVLSLNRAAAAIGVPDSKFRGSAAVSRSGSVSSSTTAVLLKKRRQQQRSWAQVVASAKGETFPNLATSSASSVAHTSGTLATKLGTLANVSQTAQSVDLTLLHASGSASSGGSGALHSRTAANAAGKVGFATTAGPSAGAARNMASGRERESRRQPGCVCL